MKKIAGNDEARRYYGGGGPPIFFWYYGGGGDTVREAWPAAAAYATARGYYGGSRFSELPPVLDLRAEVLRGSVLLAARSAEEVLAAVPVRSFWWWDRRIEEKNMKRIKIQPRENWQTKVEASGLLYHHNA